MGECKKITVLLINICSLTIVIETIEKAQQSEKADNTQIPTIF